MAAVAVLVGLFLVWQFDRFGGPETESGDAARTGDGAKAASEGAPEIRLEGAPGASDEARTPPAPDVDEARASAEPERGPASPPPPGEEIPYRIVDWGGDPSVGSLRVLVTDESGHPKDGAVLQLYGFESGQARQTHEVALEADGMAEVQDLEPGRRALWIQLADLRRMTIVEVKGGSLTEVVFALPAGATLTGVVRHAEKGPLPRIQIQLKRHDGPWRDGFFTATDENGRYRIEGILPGTYPVSLTGDAIGYHPRPRAEVTILGGETITRDFVLGRAPLEGVVRETGSGRALSGVRITLQDPLYVTATSDAEGSYRFLDVPAGEYTLAVSKDGYGFRFVKTGPVDPDATLVLDIELEPAAVLHAEIRDTAGNPVLGEVVISIRPAGDGGGTSLSTNLPTDDRGVLHYRRIVPGTYRLGVQADGYEALEQEAVVTAGETTLRFELTPLPLPPEAEGRASLEGVIRDAVTGAPIPGVRIQCQRPIWRDGSSDATGAYRLADLPPGSYLIMLSKDGYGIEFIRGVEVPAVADDGRDFTLQPAAVLHLRLTGRDGRPVTGDLTLVLDPREEGGTNLGTGITADIDGIATYRQILPGTYEIVVTAEGAGRASVEAEIRLGENTVDLRME
jgi:hypothetical protein